MKKIIIILLTILGFSCKAQEPDVHSYSQEYVDSIVNVNHIQINDLSSNYQAQLDSCSSLIELLQSGLSTNEITAIADTFNFEVVDDRIKVEVSKLGYDIRILIEDGEKRLNADYINYERHVYCMDSTYTVGSLFINNTSTRGFSVVDFNH